MSDQLMETDLIIDEELNASRIQALRERCQLHRREGRNSGWYGGFVAIARGLRASSSETSWQVRKGYVCRERLRSLEFVLDDDELLVGRLAPMGESEKSEVESAKAYCAEHYRRAGGQTGHCELYRDELFQLGLDGLLAKLAGLESSETDDEKRDFYRSAQLALHGFQEMIEHAGDCVQRSLAGCSDASRRVELESMLSSCRWIANHPVRDFRDGIQLLWFMDLGVMYGDESGLVVSGRLDRTLISYYERDMSSGRLTADDALALIECLYILINEFVPDGLAMSVMAGGRDASGADWCNDLSYLSFEALRRTRLVYPTVGLCWHEDVESDLMDLAVELVCEGIPNVGFFGDDTIQRGLQALGVPSEESCNYINSTCVEITPVGRSGVWVASPYFNVCQYLLDEIWSQSESDSPVGSFTEFIDCYKERLSGRIRAAVGEQNRLREERRQWGRRPLQSVFTLPCVERGRDVDDGGAKYNWVECSFVGMANLADCLEAIRQLIFEEKSLDFRSMRSLLESDFADSSWLARINRLPKYGNCEAGPDGLLSEFIGFAEAECAKQVVEPDGTRFVPGAFCWIMHERFGRETGATPDGRRRGTPFADGCGPAQGRERFGPTSAILSTTSWRHDALIGGAAFNMKFTPAVLRSEGAAAKLRDLIVVYLRRGGFETQINCVDAETMKRAREDPDSYRDLIVRIGGYTDYFVRISREMQDELILRTEYGL